VVSDVEQQVPEGYKQTEAGVIPEDWGIKEFSSVVKDVIDNRGKTPPLVVDGYQMLEVNAVYKQGKNPNLSKVTKYVSKETFNNWFRDGHPERGNILVVTVGSAGETSYVDAPSFCIAQNLIALKVSNSFDAEFIFYVTKTRGFRQQVDAVLMGAVQPSLKVPHLMKLNFSSPSDKEEQTAIANALSDVDALITSLEKLIVKKRAIKTAAMQQLLTGKKRLPPFCTGTCLSGDGMDGKEPIDKSRTGYKQTELGEIPEDWEVMLFSDLCASFTTGKLDANAMKPDGDYRFYTCAKNYSLIDVYAFNTEALLVSGNGANVGYVHYYSGKFNAYQRTYVLSEFSADVGYLKLFLERKLADRIRVEVNAGSTPYITMDTLTDMIVGVPSSIDEQSAIAKVLSDMDVNIDAIELRLTKTKQLKQGMMQELLTGRTRLV
jgi:type I restriction enzyme, S subunit